jgi:hypothetical protein
MIEEGSDEEVDNFSTNINALAINVLELNLCQYSDTSQLFIDSGAPKHVVGNNKLFTNIKDGKGIPKIKIASGTTHLIVGKGNLVIHVGKNA